METVIRQKIVVTTFHNKFLSNHRFQFYGFILTIIIMGCERIQVTVLYVAFDSYPFAICMYIRMLIFIISN